MWWGDHDQRQHIDVTCEECGYKCRLAARLGDPGHEPGDVVPMICPSCEAALRLRIPGETPARERM
jgi:RNase P subunit RPR2